MIVRLALQNFDAKHYCGEVPIRNSSGPQGQLFGTLGFLRFAGNGIEPVISLQHGLT